MQLDFDAGHSDHVAVPLSRISQFDDVRTCAFCIQPVDVATFGDGLVLTVERDGRIAKQELYAHPLCVRAALHSRMTFDLEMFDD